MASLCCRLPWIVAGRREAAVADTTVVVVTMLLSVYGLRTNKVIAVNGYSLKCQLCTLGKCQKDSYCSNPQEYEGSAKAMEAQGAVDACLQLLAAGCYIGELVSDDDSTQRAIVCRKTKELKENNVSVEEIQKEKGRWGEGKCRGVLPFDNGPCIHLADINHRVRSFKSKMYKLVYAKQSISICEKSDAERLGRNFAFAVHMYSSNDLPTFKKKVLCALEHHFDDHEHCDQQWCRGGEGKKYRSKIRHPKLYKDLKEIFQTVTTDEKLKHVQHSYSTNLCEATMGMVTHCSPKNKHYSKTTAGKGRLMMAVGTASIGRYDYYKQLLPKIGAVLDPVLFEHLKRRDKRTERQRLRQSADPFKKKRAKTKVDQIKIDTDKTFRDRKRGRVYSSGMALEQSGPESTDTSRQCPECGILTRPPHKTRRSSQCLLHDEYTSTRKNGCGSAPTNQKQNKPNEPQQLTIAYDETLDEIAFENQQEEEEEMVTQGITVDKP
mmetsp:Transcript_37340/g.90740  ORF Transcript_37340/g.90740 Transcript_37340/m.90740 type:complete len:493 (+) Transcript_37340:1541-3019(+)